VQVGPIALGDLAPAAAAPLTDADDRGAARLAPPTAARKRGAPEPGGDA
jgi:hypothetical protein